MPGIVRVIAHTHDENVASVRVLERNAFVRVGPGREGSIQFARER
jgi:RimJ/RimL family protein N-acetyltransferase